jgi:hypothetical protein
MVPAATRLSGEEDNDTHSRRAAQTSASAAQRRSKGLMANRQRGLFRADTPPDVTSVRAESSRHRKSTADRWNR